MIIFLPPSISDPLFWSIQFRERFERKDDADFDATVSDNSGTWFTRGRLSMTYALSNDSSISTTYQYIDSQIVPTVGSQSHSKGEDLVEAYITRNSGGSTLTIGRQKVNKGAQRMIGALEWANSSRSWLGVRFKTNDWDFFWGDLAVNPVPNYETQLVFASKNSTLGETMLAYKINEKPALRQSVTMLDHRMVRRFGNWNMEIEGAYQWGRSGGRSHDAWAMSANVSRKYSDALSSFVECNIATGGKSASENHTFDNFYPTNHIYYGYMDRQGLSNMTSLAVGVTWKPKNGMSLEATYHTFSLYNATDSWYGAGGTQNGAFINPTGASGKDIGSEFDLLWKWDMTPMRTLETGIGLFDGGGFVDKMLGSPVEQNFWGYVSCGIKF